MEEEYNYGYVSEYSENGFVRHSKIEKKLDIERIINPKKKREDYNCFHQIKDNIFLREFVLQNPNWLETFEYTDSNVCIQRIIKFYEKRNFFQNIAQCKSTLQKCIFLSDKCFNNFNIIAIDLSKKIFIGYPKQGQMYIIDFCQGKNDDLYFKFESINQTTDNVDDNAKKIIIQHLEGNNNGGYIHDGKRNKVERRGLLTINFKDIYSIWKRNVMKMNKNYVKLKEDKDTEKEIKPKPIEGWDDWEEFFEPTEYYENFVFDEEKKIYSRPYIHFCYNIVDLYFKNIGNDLRQICENDINKLMYDLKFFRGLTLLNEINFITCNVIEINLLANTITCINVEKEGILYMIIYNFITKEITFKQKIEFSYYKTKILNMKKSNSWT